MLKILFQMVSTFSVTPVTNEIIRPNRCKYNEDELGFTEFNFYGKDYVRKDYTIEVTNKIKIKCSFIEPSDRDRPAEIMPVVIYIHGNASCRVEGIKYCLEMLKNDINLFVFDSAGCGKSEGKYISLGINEKNDLKYIVNFVQNLKGVGKIGIWGRSMGASTAVLYTSELDCKVNCLVCDSCFSDFKILCKEIWEKNVGTSLDFLFNFFFDLIRRDIIEKARFDLLDLNIAKAIRKTKIPVLFIHAYKDDFINIQHTYSLFDNCGSKDRFLTMCKGTHFTIRDERLLNKIFSFFVQYLKK